MAPRVGVAAPAALSFGWSLAKARRQSDLGAPVTQICHGSAPEKAFPASLDHWVVLTPCWLGVGTLPGGL